MEVIACRKGHIDQSLYQMMFDTGRDLETFFDLAKTVTSDLLGFFADAAAALLAFLDKSSAS
jgi:hypothetical protein